MKLLYLFMFSSLPVAFQAQEIMNGLLRTMGALQYHYHCVNQKVTNYEYNKCGVAFQGLMNTIMTSKSPLNDVIERFCKNKTNFCGEVLEEKAYDCFNETQKRYLFYYNAAEHAGWKAGCKDDEKLIRDLYYMNFGSCPSTLKEDDKLCVAQETTLLSGIKLIDAFSRNNCLKYFKNRDCFADMYKYCTDKSAYEYITETINARFKNTPCKASILGFSSLLVIIFAFIQIQNLLF